MIFPSKHISLVNSLLGIGSIILDSLDQPISLNKLWPKINNQINTLTFDKFILSLDFLFILGLISIKNTTIERIALDYSTMVNSSNILYEFEDFHRGKKVSTQDEFITYMFQVCEVLKNDIA